MYKEISPLSHENIKMIYSHSTINRELFYRANCSLCGDEVEVIAKDLNSEDQVPCEICGAQVHFDRDRDFISPRLIKPRVLGAIATPYMDHVTTYK